eukprot:TRINITY_DN60599_c0_g1_i1.p1 TRINITY_DN60599_c0_g1~~TRINITY_DN60599_c0_g1_i1.p1  ORF type:complete len:478 (+),score=91.06 TRINITY_DN60599_c0_g1_i1:84-1436(+)
MADQEKQDLVQQIRLLQKTKPGFSQAWTAFASRAPGSGRDPARYDVQVLRDALAQLGGDVPLIDTRGGLVTGIAQPAAMPGSDSEHGVLVVRMRGLLKGNREIHAAWSELLRERGLGGVGRDPVRHTTELLQEALALLDPNDGQASLGVSPVAHGATGALPVTGGGGRFHPYMQGAPALGGMAGAPLILDHGDLVRRVHTLQKSEPGFREAWIDFLSRTQMASVGRDPARHSTDFLVSALQELAPAALPAGGGVVAMPGMAAMALSTFMPGAVPALGAPKVVPLGLPRSASAAPGVAVAQGAGAAAGDSGSWKRNDSVEALFQGEWHPATVGLVHGDGTYTVVWDDNTKTEGVTAEEIRAPPGVRGAARRAVVKAKQVTVRARPVASAASGLAGADFQTLVDSVREQINSDAGFAARWNVLTSGQGRTDPMEFDEAFLRAVLGLPVEESL